MDPYKLLALKMIEAAKSNLLASPSNAHAQASARSAGFENSEHEALAFIASDLFDAIVQSLGLDPLEQAQRLIEQRWDDVQVIQLDKPIPSNGNGRYAKRRRVKHLGDRVRETPLLEEYDRRIAESESRRARSSGAGGRPRRALQPPGDG